MNETLRHEIVQRWQTGMAVRAIARELGITANVVFVNACRVLKQVTNICQEFDEDPRDALDSSHLSRRN